MIKLSPRVVDDVSLASKSSYYFKRFYKKFILKGSTFHSLVKVAIILKGSTNLAIFLNVSILNCSRAKFFAIIVNLLVLRLEEEYWYSTVF